MKNQTIHQKDILELGQEFSSVPGYCLVVYKKGAVKEILPEGQAYRASFFEKKSLEMIGVVSPSTSRTISFKSSYFHSDSIHQFVMEYYLSYQVENVRLLADKRLQDPLKKIMEKIKHSVGSQIGKVPWDELYNSDAGDFEEIRKQVLSYESVDLSNQNKSTTQIIKAFASSFGILLVDIDFKFIIPENYVIQKKTREKAKIKREIKQIEHEDAVIDKMNEREIKIMEAQNEASRMYYSLYEAVETAVKNVGSSIDNPEKFLQAVEAGIKAQNLVQTKLIPPSGTQQEQALGAGASAPQLGAGTFQSSNNVMNETQYMKLITTLKDADISYDTKKSFFAKYIRLVAAVLEEDSEAEDQLIDELVDMGLSAKLNDLIKGKDKFSKEIEIILQ